MVGGVSLSEQCMTVFGYNAQCVLEGGEDKGTLS